MVLRIRQVDWGFVRLDALRRYDLRRCDVLLPHLVWLAWLVYRADCRYDAMRREHLAQRARVCAGSYMRRCASRIEDYVELVAAKMATRYALIHTPRCSMDVAIASRRAHRRSR